MLRKLLLFIFLFLSFNCQNSELPVYVAHPKKINLIEIKRTKIIQAIIKVESNGNRFAYNKKEKAFGILQIRPVMLREINRLLGENKYTLADRSDSLKSVEMFLIFQQKYNTEFDLRLACHYWNYSPFQKNFKATEIYYTKVKKVFDSLD